ncbi:polysaccharide deacetylase family protein [Ancylobacter defluvii]|uniref:Chitooligosaccharide deacetylase n=1 Tax=Ancylobacter defluvii TaxID=1282440 RepID=A0A9W6JV81_9HYPH|nr:polysaccharide deacetylase [Ancylobacter defluvii]MBS7590035.1 polysaccharide deacetylase [Ancylobacter defluvii]GLK83163.1 polysaccharide deacetylase [Ancylobacter defluvii]
MLQLIDNPPPWPNGARCAVCFSFDFDAESLLHLYYPQDSTRRISLSSSLRYGARVAVPRIARIWKHFGMKQTVFVPGWCIETYPAAIEALLEDGHELGHHGWLHERPNQLAAADERKVLELGIAAIEKVTGKPPVGYRCPSGAFSEHTLDLLIEHGFAYDASLPGDDVPYLLEGARGRLIELPSDHPLDDWPQYVNLKEFNMGMTIQSPARAMEVFRAEFDAAWNHGGLWAAIWHPFVSGRLARAEAMVELIEHMQAKGGVWFATLAEMAAHINGVIARGEWAPSVERLPFWPEPVPQAVRPSR